MIGYYPSKSLKASAQDNQIKTSPSRMPPNPRAMLLPTWDIPWGNVIATVYCYEVTAHKPKQHAEHLITMITRNKYKLFTKSINNLEHKTTLQ